MASQGSRELAYSADYASGEVLLGKYELVEKLAAGGMGAVWRARNRLLDSDVAVKVMFRGVTDATGVALQRAHTEARLAAQLQHPAVCTALDFGLSDRGDPLIVTELLRGRSLDEVLRAGGALSAVRAAQVLLPVLDGLAAAHAKGIVHRDVKPSNIFLAHGDEGAEQPKLLDFGIARGLADKQRITVAGVVCGTPDYMSPEQARGSKDVDLRSDLWSTCATLYELVTDRVPFEGDNYNSVMFSVLHDPPKPIYGLPVADRDLIAIIERGLTKDRELRFQSARELAKQLSLFLLARGVEVDACGHSLRSRLSAHEINLSESELALIHGRTPREAQRASTVRRTAVRKTSTTLAHTHQRTLTRRWSLLALGVASLLSLGAWSSRRVPPGPITLAPILIEASPVSPELGAPRSPSTTPVTLQGASAELSSPHSANAAASSTSASRKPKPRITHANALGYDFGL